MAFPTKNSRFAIVEESTEGTPVSPSSGDDFVPLREGFDFDYAFEELENSELTGSIGKAKSILGLENPSMTTDGYVRHSGVEGTAPDHNLLYKAAFGTTAIRATERDVVSATEQTITVDAGEGAEYEAGDAVLIKDSTNGYSIRGIDSVSGDILSLNFTLDTAPAALVNLGRNVRYSPVDTGHPTLTAWLYRANEANIEMASGMRVTELGMSAEAGQLIESSFSLEGIEGFFNPIEIDATNDSMDFDDGGGEENVTVAQKMYKDPHELASALQTAMDAATGDTITVSYSDSSGNFSITTDGGTLSLLWSTGANSGTTIGGAIGFDTSADDTGSVFYQSDSPQGYSSPFTPTFDDSNPLAAKANIGFLGDIDNNVCFSIRSIDFTLTDVKEDKLDICAESGKSGTVVDSREVTVDIVANIPQYDVQKFRKFRENETTKFMWNFGTKSGGNWEAGKSGSLYMKTATISAYKIGDEAGQVTMEMTLTGFVDSGNSEVFLNFV